MAFVKTHDGKLQKFPYTMGDLRNDNPHTSFPRRIPAAVLASYGVFEVEVDTSPEVDQKNYKAVRDEFPTYTNGEWRLQWSVVEKTAEEKQRSLEAAESKVRAKRDNLLTTTDWVVVSHTEKGNQIPVEWATYRQALRDVTNHANFPYLTDADWPTKPV